MGWEDKRVLPSLAAALLAASLLLGGAGDSYPLITLAIELGALLVLWYIAAVPGTRPFPLGWLPKLLLIGIVILLLLQLLPLPAFLWRQLPGRDLATGTLTLTGLDQRWRPISLYSGATVTTALEMLPALALFFTVLRLDERGRLRLVHLAVLAGLLSVLLGVLQTAGGDASAFILFDTPHAANSPGLFVNRNHQATFLLVCMLLAAGAARTDAIPIAAANLAKLIAAGLTLVFAAGVVVTTSRTGFMLLVPTVAASLLTIFPIKWNWKVTVAALALLAGLFAAAFQSSVVQSTVERFSLADERPIYWRDTLEAIRDSWPVGTGIGTFAQVYGTVQSVESVGIQYVNNAHNDYLELALEGGILAVALIGLCLVLWTFSAVRLWKRPTAGDPSRLGMAALGAIAVILLHSIFDYPLRMLSIMAMFGLLWGIVISRTDGADLDERARS